MPTEIGKYLYLRKRNEAGFITLAEINQVSDVIDGALLVGDYT
jgi:hypothetical protein